ncbi:cysteine desulfurase family protein [Domibacillus sp. DTU_2020_1001157_1_SI_ALB_TIR_016]|uniref:cysteine desulfurase family protein n=1 Tax=Domibacillus sp. DTU_2020_1001157_1_SI_ALB_TIR_016 TaxID=3077789 RepID=UPI0028E3B41B|nr:cysteine desulfurase family protein [Domibacillus sp. DTU_2020_1001157_1_SI_ALB_TIR_016]WNS81870.1 cysteine desulfurase family protein [Domibacillus sp. DTU_2020_1001157_1_SI_ALB_TIR_016]
MERIYLDHAATSPVHPEAAAAMAEVLTETYGNPSSIHSFGRESRRIVDEARSVIAATINAGFNDIIFTGSGTEADNLAILGTARSKGPGHIITTNIEHHAVLHACEALERDGFEVTYLPVNEEGIVSLSAVEDALREDTILVSIMYGNNETGALQPIEAIGQLLSGHSALFHTDAVQAYGILPIDVKKLNVDFLSVSGHKINGPKGIGALYVKPGTALVPLLYGGEQERKRRAGTENTAAIAGMAQAAKIAEQTQEERAARYMEMKKLFIDTLSEQGASFSVNGKVEHSLPHVLNLFFPETDVEAFLVNLDMAGIAASSGSACTAGSIEPSHVLTAMFGENSPKLRSSIRFSFGFNNTTKQIEQAALETAKIAKRLQ